MRRKVNTGAMGRARSGSTARESRAAMPVEKFVEMCRGVLDLCEELPERAEDFRGSVEEKVQDMMNWAEENEHVTDKMVRAVENTEAAIGRWLD